MGGDLRSRHYAQMDAGGIAFPFKSKDDKHRNVHNLVSLLVMNVNWLGSFGLFFCASSDMFIIILVEIIIKRCQSNTTPVGQTCGYQ